MSEPQHLGQRYGDRDLGIEQPVQTGYLERAIKLGCRCRRVLALSSDAGLVHPASTRNGSSASAALVCVDQQGRPCELRTANFVYA